MQTQTLLLHETVTHQWHALVNEAEVAASIYLHEDLESYLVFLLTRFTTQPHVFKSILATEFLYGLNKIGSLRREQLRDVGDKCLLFAGLFPGRAERLRLKINYFVDLGQAAYGTVSLSGKQSLNELYSALCKSFVPLMDVLQTTRELSNQSDSLSLLEAAELWQDTRSKHALAVLRRHTQGHFSHAENLGLKKH